MFGSLSRCRKRLERVHARRRAAARRRGRASTGWPLTVTVLPLAKRDGILGRVGHAVDQPGADGLGRP